jgi:predicted nucleotidyltransferase component of viral defense system
MHDIISTMLNRYKCVTQEDYKNALKEIIQEVALLGLWRAKFFEKAAFYGGTALRILHGLDRFSEDLDFSLLTPDPHFSLAPYERAIQTELESFGFQVSFHLIEKNQETAIQSAFLKANTLEHLMRIGVPLVERKRCHVEETLKIKLECDTDPPPRFSTEARFLLQPIPFSVVTFAKPDLFAGKMHALLFRNWRQRVKGRDWYDFVWFVAQGIPLHLSHLEARMKQTGHLLPHETLTSSDFHALLEEKIEKLDLEQAKKDILPFLRNREAIAVWSVPFFQAVAEKIQIAK